MSENFRKLRRAHNLRHKEEIQSNQISMSFSTTRSMNIYIHKAFPMTKHFSVHCLPTRPSSDGILQESDEIIHTKHLGAA